MADRVFVVGAYVANDDPLLRVRAFVPLPAEHKTLAEAVAAAEYHDLEDWGERAPASLVGQRRLMAQGIPNPAMHCGEGLKR